jgi:hypothetical protein
MSINVEKTIKLIVPNGQDHNNCDNQVIYIRMKGYWINIPKLVET